MPIELSGNDFGEYYYSHDCGIPYERTEHWLTFFDNIADRIVKELEPKSVLDAGCAWGFLVEALRNRGVEAWGIDISEYAISNVHESIKDYCQVGSIVEPFDRRYDLIVNIEVLEHMQKAEAIKAIENFCLSSDRVLFSSTPFDYKEVTHINVQVPEYWSREFARHGFFRDLNFDASFITPWSSLFVKRQKSIPDLIYEYENKFWTLNKENVDLRQHVMEQVSKMEEIERLEVHFVETTKKLQEATESQHRDIERLNEHIRTIETANSVLLEERQKLREATESQQGEIERLNEQIRTIETANSALLEEQQKLKEATESQQSDIDRLNEQIKTLEAANAHLVEIQNDLQTANEKLGFLYNQWDALKSSRTWKLLQRLGRFKTFPDLSRQAVEKLFSQSDPSNTKTTPVDKDPLLKENLIDTTSFFKESKIGHWVFKPITGIVALSGFGEFVSTSDDPQLLIRPEKGGFLSGSVEVRCWLVGEQEEYPLRFYYDIGNGFNERDAFSMEAITNSVSHAKVDLPAGIKAMRFDPGVKPGKITIKEFDLQNISTLTIFRKLWADNKHKIDGVDSLLKMIGKAFDVIRNGGFGALEDRAYPNMNGSYQQWISRYDMLTNADHNKIKREISNFSLQPLISVVMPTYNTNPELLRQTIQSVRNQLYPNWELCIADDFSTNEQVREVIQAEAKEESRIRFVFRAANGHISEATNSALELATGSYVAFLDHDDLLSQNALFEVAKVINNNPDVGIIYSDEDKINEDDYRYDPYFKPDWNPDLFLGQNFINHLSVYKLELIKKIGGLRVGYEGAQDWDLAFRVIEQIVDGKIVHIPKILYHWRATPGSTAKDITQKDYIAKAQGKVLDEHFSRTGQSVKLENILNAFWKIEYEIPKPSPLVSIIIPTRNQKMILEKCIDSLTSLTDYEPYELLVVDNGSDEEETLQYLEKLKADPRITVLDYPWPFNYSAINNFAVKKARGAVLCLLNNDIEIINGDWLKIMVSLAVRPETGAIGAKLLYPDHRIQHAGVILGLGGVAGHAYLLKDENYIGQMGRALLMQNYSAVTAACMVVEKAKYEQVGGFNENELKIAFNDIDFCIRLMQAGYRNVWTPEAKLIHHESVSRGFDDTPDKQERFKSEINYMKETWGEILENDPAYNPNLTLDHEAFTLAFPPRVSRV